MNAGRRCFVDPSVLFQATGEPFKALKDVICFRPCRSERPRSTTTLPSLLFAVHSPKMTSGVFLTVANMRGTLGWVGEPEDKDPKDGFHCRSSSSVSWICQEHHWTHSPEEADREKGYTAHGTHHWKLEQSQSNSRKSELEDTVHRPASDARAYHHGANSDRRVRGGRCFSRDTTVPFSAIALHNG